MSSRLTDAIHHRLGGEVFFSILPVIRAASAFSQVGSNKAWRNRVYRYVIGTEPPTMVTIPGNLGPISGTATLRTRHAIPT
jgi:hypothetical protein